VSASCSAGRQSLQCCDVTRGISMLNRTLFCTVWRVLRLRTEEIGSCCGVWLRIY
jgi:hypothetical protein